jgi:hypothetical protein
MSILKNETEKKNTFSLFRFDLIRISHCRKNVLCFAFTSLPSSLLSPFSRFSPIDLVPIHLRDHVNAKKDWKLFKCRTCAFITHAENKTDPNVVVIVTNISVPKTTEKPIVSVSVGQPTSISSATTTTTTSSSSAASTTTTTTTTTMITATPNSTSTSNATLSTTTTTTTYTSGSSTVTTTPPPGTPHSLGAGSSSHQQTSTPRIIVSASPFPPSPPIPTSTSTSSTTNINVPVLQQLTMKNTATNPSTSLSDFQNSPPKESSTIGGVNSPRVRPNIPKLTIITSPRYEKSDKN